LLSRLTLFVGPSLVLHDINARINPWLGADWHSCATAIKDQ
jgi:hypothetical protein